MTFDCFPVLYLKPLFPLAYQLFALRCFRATVRLCDHNSSNLDKAHCAIRQFVRWLQLVLTLVFAFLDCGSEFSSSPHRSDQSDCLVTGL